MVNIKQIIASGESLKVEFKKQLSDKNEKVICKEIAALATVGGGYLLIGVDDSGDIYGVKDAKGIIQKLESWVANYIVPLPIIDCVIIDVEDKQVIAVTVSEGHGYSPIYAYDGKYFGRTNTASHPLTLEQIANILRGVTLEQALSSIQNRLASVAVEAANALYAASPSIIGQGDLATQSYSQISARLLREFLSSPEMMALRSTIAVAESMAAVAMHSAAPSISGQGDLATENYVNIRERIFNDLDSATALNRVRAEIATVSNTLSIARLEPSQSIYNQGDLATMAYSALVDRLMSDPKIRGIAASTESVAQVAQSVAFNADAKAQMALDKLDRLGSLLVRAGSA